VSSSYRNSHRSKDYCDGDGNEDGWARVQEVGRRFLYGVEKGDGGGDVALVVW
jgi:hypothetical protein